MRQAVPVLVFLKIEYLSPPHPIGVKKKGTRPHFGKQGKPENFPQFSLGPAGEENTTISGKPLKEVREARLWGRG